MPTIVQYAETVTSDKTTELVLNVHQTVLPVQATTPALPVSLDGPFHNQSTMEDAYPVIPDVRPAMEC